MFSQTIPVGDELLKGVLEIPSRKVRESPFSLDKNRGAQQYFDEAAAVFARKEIAMKHIPESEAGFMETAGISRNHYV